MAFSLEASLIGVCVGKWHLLNRKHGNKLWKLGMIFFLECSAHGTNHHKSWASEYRGGGGYCLNTCQLYHFKLGRPFLMHQIAPGFANAHLRTSLTACSACAQAGTLSWVVAQVNEIWDHLHSVGCYCCKPAGMTIVNSTSASPLLPPARKCVAHCNPWCQL